MFKILSRHKDKFKSVFYVFLAFVVAKALTFLIPIKIFDLVESEAEYGYFEYALNLGQTITGFLAMGLSGSYAYFITKNDRTELIPAFHLHFSLLSALIVSSAIVYWPLMNSLVFKGLIIGNVFANQVFISSYLKLKGKNIQAVIFDSGIYVLMAIFVLLSIFSNKIYNVHYWFISLLIYLILVVLIFHLPRLKGFKNLTLLNFRELYSFGGLVMLSGPLLVLITANTRLYIEFFNGVEHVAVYSIVFRIVSIVLIMSRVSTILMFRRMFVNDHENLDKNYTFILIGVFLVSVIAYYSIPWILDFFKLNFYKVIEENYFLYKLCFIQIVLWIGVSLLEILFQRENIMKQFLLIVTFSLLIMLLLMLTAHYFYNLALLGLVVLNIVGLTLLFVLQILILRKKVFFYKMTLTSTLLIVLFCTLLMW